MARVWKLCIRPDPEAPDRTRGYALAETAEEAAAIARHPPHLLVFPKPEGTRWPGRPGAVLDWDD